MWGKLDFIPLEERAGRSAAGHPLMLWCYRLAPDDELGLWSAEASDDTLDIVIDAQIFFDFDADETPNTLISKGLLNDFLIDSLNLWITDELFLEIDRNSNTEGRMNSLNRARGFNRIEHDQIQVEGHKAALKSVLPYSTDSEKSDLHHVAKTAASGVTVFVTKDEGILKQAAGIKERCGVDVLHPVALITSIHEEMDHRSYAPSRVSGFRLCWRTVRDGDIDQLCENRFRKPGESKGKLRELIRSYIADPRQYRPELLVSDGNPVAYRVMDRSKRGCLRVSLARVARSPELDLFGSFLIADTLAIAVAEGLDAVEFDCSGVPDLLDPIFVKMGFIGTTDAFLRFAIARTVRIDTALERVAEQSPTVADALRLHDNLTLERMCAPLVSSQNLPCYLVPIRPAFAMGLLDRDQSSDDLFGGDPTVLLRWANVYYRAKHQQHMLKAPGRILWYVSGSVGEIVAISHLDEVECGLPKELFRKYKKFGILEWRDIHELCKRDIAKEIMALKFSLTFTFRNRIPLDALRTIFKEEGVGVSLQAPSLLPHSALLKIFELGYPPS